MGAYAARRMAGCRSIVANCVLHKKRCRALTPSSSHTSASVTPGWLALLNACRLNSALYRFLLAMTHLQALYRALLVVRKTRARPNSSHRLSSPNRWCLGYCSWVGMMIRGLQFLHCQSQGVALSLQASMRDCQWLFLRVADRHD